jgi:hypothetical protein
MFGSLRKVKMKIINGKPVCNPVRAIRLRDVDHPKTGGNRYCGPAVISALTGLDTGETAALLRHVTGKRSIKGTSHWSVRRALALCGIDTLPNARGDFRPTLARWHRWAREAGLFTGDAVWLIVAGNHWQAVTARRYVCGRIGKIVSIRDERVKRRARVDAAYRVTLLPA